MSQDIRLYSYWRSSCSYRVRIALALKNLPYRYHAVHLLQHGGEQHQASYRAINPQGRVPSLSIDGHLLTQSMAILEYLEETRPQPALLPVDPAGRARVRALAAVVTCDIQPLQNLGVTQYLHDSLGSSKDQVRAWLQHWITHGLTALEAQLARDADTGRYCHGETPTLADVCLVPQCYAALRFGVMLTDYPTITRIYESCLALDAFQRAAPEVQPDADVPETHG